MPRPPNLSAILRLWLLAAASVSAAPDFDAVRPVLERTCFDCHGGNKTKGGVDLKKLAPEPKVAGEFELWTKVQEVVRKGEMPPEDAKAPLSEGDRAALLSWVDSSLERVAQANAGDPGLVTLKRLTKAEYNYTIRDLTGVDLQAGGEFPADGGGGEGFSNLGDVLFVNPQQLDKYFTAARKVADHASVLPGSGVQFYPNRIGLRGPSQVKAEVEASLYRWYQEVAMPHLPKDEDDLREGEYILACWKWKHKEITGVQSLEALAEAAALEPAFLNNWWNFLQTSEPKSRFLDLTRQPWNALPPPEAQNPHEVPAKVSASIESIRTQRRSWLLPKKWTVQRAQQDSDGIRAWPMETEIHGERWVNVVFGDLGDGNKGDWAFLENAEFKRGGKFEGYFSWLQKQIGDDRQTLDSASSAALPIPNRPALEERVKDGNALLAMLGKHPLGVAMDAQTLIVQAPRVLRLPLPDGVQAFKAKGRLDLNHPDAEFATIQWMLTAGTVPNPSAIIPGVLTVWKRGTKAHNLTIKEFDAMKSVFPDSLERRLEEVSRNYQRGGKGPSVYYYNDSQLEAILSEKQRLFLKHRLQDWSFVRNLTLPKNRETEWDELVLGHLFEFASHAWRRPLEAAEKGQLSAIYKDAISKELDRESAAREVLVRVLVAPAFLFKLETGNEPGTHPVKPWEFASRLSYFLWSSLPDAQLREKAAANALLQPDVLRGEIERMLRDERAGALAREFAGQWFEFHGFDAHLKVDTGKFPEFTPELRQDLYTEAVGFFTHLIRHNKPVRDILRADYTFLNERLAKFYGIPDVQGPDMRLCTVEKFGRGGLLGMGAILTKTSYPHRTSPVLRGSWLLHNVLGSPTPPPPNDVPKLEESVAAAQTLRERLERHRADQACSGCHDKIDPLGFALESFDAIGRYRTSDETGGAIDDSAQTKDGKKFSGLAGLRSYLQDREREFLFLFSRKLLGYALGRTALPSDKPLLEEMHRGLSVGDGSFGGAVNVLVQSRQFKERRNDP